MQEQLPQLAFELTQADPNIWGVAILDASGNIMYRTENWDISAEVAVVAQSNEKTSSLTLTGVRFVVVENTPERIIATNVMGKGHVIVCPAGRGKIACYINPAAGPRDCLLSVMNYARKIGAFL